MTEKEYILKLLDIALLEIREASYLQDYHRCFVLSDIFHNVPLRMNRADKGEMSYADIVTGIRQKCEQRNCIAWLENATQHVAKMP
jgi:hypothetical protein